MRALAGYPPKPPAGPPGLIAGHDLKASTRSPPNRPLAYVPDDPHLFDSLTIWEHFQFIAAAYRIDPDWPAFARRSLLEAVPAESRSATPLDDGRFRGGCGRRWPSACGYLHEPRASSCSTNP